VRLPPLSPEKLEWLKDARDVNFPISQYMGEISYVDEYVGRLLELLANVRIENNTIIVLTADHGESMTEHDVYFEHYGLFEDIIRVPLILYVPDAPYPPKKVTALVESVDIYPTVLDLLELPVPEDLRGKSLLPVMRGESEVHRKNAYSEMAHGLQRAIRTDTYKLIESLSDGNENYSYMFHKGDLELYRLQTDPQEMKNRAVPDAAIASELRTKLNQWSKDFMKLESPEKKEVSPEMQEHLRALGYLE
jgi:arylsulfatase A-like enzyme